MSKTVTLRLSDANYEKFVIRAKVENRSLSNLIETKALKQIEEDSFVGDDEMGEIISNEVLLKKLRRGATQAKALKGRFVE